MSKSTHPSLTVVASPCLAPGTRFLIGHQRCRIGRGARNEIRIEAPGVADEHAKIEFRYGRFILEVLADDVNTSVNREPVRQSRRLLPGDSLEIAGTSFQFRLRGDPSHDIGAGREVTQSAGAASTDEAEIVDAPRGGAHVLATARFALPDLMAAVSADDLRRDFDRIKTAFDAVSTLLNTFDLAELCERMLEAVFDLVPAEHAAVLLRREDGSLWSVRERSRPSSGSVPAVSQTVVDHVLAHKEAVLAMDVGADARFSDAESIQAAHVRSLMEVPLLAGEDVLGVLHVVSTSRAGAFREADLELVSALGVGAGLVLSNNHLYRQLEDALERQVAFNQILKKTVDERTAELRVKNEELSKTLARLRATQDQIIAQEKLASLGTLTSGIAHEMLNPLNFINNFASIVSESVEELRGRLDGARDARGSEFQELFDDIEMGSRAIRKHGLRVEKVVLGMRQLSKAEGGERSRTDLNEVISNLVGALRHEDSARGPRIVTTLDPDMMPIDAVVRDLSHALLNMLHNAIQAVQARLEQAPPEGWAPEVSICSEDHGDHVVVVIRDNGEGIAPEIRQRVFEPFFTTKPTDQGIGLGLSVAHDVIVKVHGGSIVIDSERGESTELRVTLPRLDQVE